MPLRYANNDVIEQFRPAWPIQNRHMQSVLASRPPRAQLIRRRWLLHAPDTQDVIVECDDGVRLLGHFTPATNGATRSLVVLIHGWEGSADSVYLLSAAMSLRSAGHAVFRLNLRDHGPSHHLNEGLFHSCRLPEVAQAVEWVRQRYKPERFSVAGFSLGGNFALRVAALQESSPVIDKVVAICPVLNPATTMQALDSGWFLYRHFFLRKWRRSLLKKQQCYPNTYQFKNLERFTRLESMTDHFVRHYTEYADLRAYLAGYAITGDRLAQLPVTSTMLLANDDPVIPVQDIELLNSSAELKVIRSERGGHCGFFTRLYVPDWLDRFIVSQLEQESYSSGVS